MNSVPKEKYPFYPKSGDYVAFIGTMTPRKGALEALEAAVQAGVEIRFAGTYQDGHNDYTAKLKAKIKQHGFKFLGNISGQEKLDFMGNAKGLMFYFQWPEPGSYATVEALALGTPIITSKFGVGPVMAKDAGFVANTPQDMAGCIKRLDEINRKDVRKRYESYFTPDRQANEYLDIYREVLLGKRW